MKDYNEKWYLLGSIIGIFAGITIGWFLYSPKQITVKKLNNEVIELKKENNRLNEYVEELQDENHILGSELANREYNKK